MPATKKKKKGSKGKARTTENRLDLYGVGVVFLGLVSALGIYGDWAGPVGRLLESLWRGLFGWSAYLVPPALLWIGFLNLRRAEKDEPGRVAAAAVMCLVAVSAFRHLAMADDSSGLRLDAVGEVGGVIGGMIAYPLRRLLSVWGAAITLSLLLLVGILSLTKTPVSKVMAWLQVVAGFAGKGVQWALGKAAEAISAAVSAVRPKLAQLWGRVRDMRPPALEAGAMEAIPEADSDGVEEDERAASIEELEIKPGHQVRLEIGADRVPAGAKKSRTSYRLPSMDLLETTPEGSISKRAIEETIMILERTLTQFGVDAEVTGYTPGPTVTRYEIELGEAVKVNSVVGLQNEIRYALASGELRILAPIPGRSAIGIEVPNRDRQLVSLGDVLRSAEGKSMRHPLGAGLGKDISGAPVMVNLADMPHLLIAGATGSGKSSCINAMITSVLMRARPDQVRMLLIDPKRVELSHYNGVPHLLTPVVTSPRKASEALAWMVKEMEARYEILALAGMRNADLYNEAIRAGAIPNEFEDGMPRQPFANYLVVIDELADLMMVAPREVEDSICRIAQMARAVGIHLIVATQRPSVDVVTGVIKANIPSRLAFATASAADSRVILDEGGADRLIGLGDMLYKHASAARPRRIQGAWVAEREIQSINGWCRRQQEAMYLEGIVSETRAGADYGADDDDEELLRQALELVVRSQLGSTSMLQRKLKVGFARAGRLMDLLEQRGIVGPSLGSKPRDVLMTVEELHEMLSRDGEEEPAGV